MLRSSVRRKGLVAAGLCAALLAMTACNDTSAEPSGSGSSPTTGSSQTTSPGSSETPSSTPSDDPAAATVRTVPAQGAKSVRPDQPVTVSVESGTIQAVTVKDDDGEKVDGELNAEKSQWTAKAGLKPNAKYTISGTAQGGDGKTVPISSTFSTLTAKSSLKASVAPLNGETVGVAMPVQIWWNRPVKDRAAVEKRLTVTSTPKVEGSWHWVSSTQVNYRPKNYWPAGTKVSVDIAIQGVSAAPGLWGGNSRTISFGIGKSVVTRIDVKRHRMVVEINGRPARTIPITAGKTGFTTRSGVKVIQEKFRVKRMDARTVGIKPGDPEYYDIHDVKWAQRVTNSGEFIHGAPWSGGSQGRDNVSHGCIGMSLANGAWYFNQTLRGDPVIVTGTARRMEPGNGITDWNAAWAAYKSGSALS